MSSESISWKKVVSFEGIYEGVELGSWDFFSLLSASLDLEKKPGLIFQYSCKSDKPGIR